MKIKKKKFHFIFALRASYNTIENKRVIFSGFWLLTTVAMKKTTMMVADVFMQTRAEHRTTFSVLSCPGVLSPSVLAGGRTGRNFYCCPVLQDRPGQDRTGHLPGQIGYVF